MTTENFDEIRCKVCGAALPLFATVCPNCGGNSSLIQMIEKIPRAAYTPHSVGIPAQVTRPEKDRVETLHQAVSAQNGPAARGREAERATDRVVGVQPVALPRKQPSQPAAAARVSPPAAEANLVAAQALPRRRPPVAPPRPMRSDADQVRVESRPAPSPAVPGQAAAVEMERSRPVHDTGGLRLPEVEAPVVRDAALKRWASAAVSAVRSNLKTSRARRSSSATLPVRTVGWSRRFVMDWLLPTVLISVLFFLFMEFLARNYQARASGIAYQDPQATVQTLRNSLSQAEATISAQQNTILALQGIIAAQPNPTVPQATAPAAPTDLSKTLLLGPLDGMLAHSNDGLIKTFWAGQDAKNFVLSVVLVNPYSGAYHPWDVCIRFRRVYTDEYRLTIFSTRLWTLTSGLSIVPVASGTLPNLKTGEAESNDVSLQVMNGTASLSVNDVALPAMDVSAYQASGDVGIAIGTQKGDEVDGMTTLFKGFTLWSIP